MAFKYLLFLPPEYPTYNNLRIYGDFAAVPYSPSKLIFPALLLSLFVLNFIFVVNQPWSGDFWLHAALVRALQEHLFLLRDPFIPDFNALIPFWPYEALVAIFSKVLGISAINGLVVFSFINLTLLLLALRRFCLAYHSSPWFFLVFFIFMLGCWGREISDGGAFLQASSFFNVLSYPSTIALALALLGIARIAEQASAENKSSFLRPTDILIATLVLLTHPATFIFYCCSILPVVLCQDQRHKLLDLLKLALLIGLPIVSWIFWTPFPFGEVVRNWNFTSKGFAEKIFNSLDRVIGLAWPIFLILVLRNTPLRQAKIELTIVLLSGLFFYGFISQNCNYCSLFPFLMLMLQLSLTREVFYANDYTPRFSIVRKGVAMLLLAVSLLQMLSIFGEIFTNGQIVNDKQPRLISRLSAVERQIPANEMIFAGAKISKLLPALGRRVFVFDVEPCFRFEYGSRFQQQMDFFQPITAMSRRFQTIRDNAITTILVDYTVNQEATVGDALIESGKFESVDLNHDLKLLTVKPDPYLTLFQFRKDRHGTETAAPADNQLNQ